MANVGPTELLVIMFLVVPALVVLSLVLLLSRRSRRLPPASSEQERARLAHDAARARELAEGLRGQHEAQAAARRDGTMNTGP